MKTSDKNHRNLIDQNMIAILKEISDVLERHKGGLVYTTDDDGIHVTLNDDWERKACIGWPANGNVAHIRRLIEENTKNEKK